MSNILGYAIFRDGKQVGIEKTLACAKHWVESEIIPVCAAKDAERFARMESALKVIHTWASVDGGLWPPHVYDLCERSLA